MLDGLESEAEEATAEDNIASKDTERANRLTDLFQLMDAQVRDARGLAWRVLFVLFPAGFTVSSCGSFAVRRRLANGAPGGECGQTDRVLLESARREPATPGLPEV